MALKVIGAGQGRTGTLSLKLALEHLGFGPCHHIIEVMSAGRERFPLWLDVVRGSPDWDTIFDGFVSTVDHPACTYWRELAAHFPEAKVILSTRDPEGWFDSVQRTIFSPELIAHLGKGPNAEIFREAVWKPFGDRINDRDFMVDRFRRWEADIVAALPPECLLVHRSAEGWDPLCAFLGVPVPAIDYPHVNSAAQVSSAQARILTEAASPEEAEARAQGYVESMRNKSFGEKGS